MTITAGVYSLPSLELGLELALGLDFALNIGSLLLNTASQEYCFCL